MPCSMPFWVLASKKPSPDVAPRPWSSRASFLYNTQSVVFCYWQQKIGYTPAHFYGITAPLQGCSPYSTQALLLHQYTLPTLWATSYPLWWCSAVAFKCWRNRLKDSTWELQADFLGLLGKYYFCSVSHSSPPSGLSSATPSSSMMLLTGSFQ